MRPADSGTIDHCAEYPLVIRNGLCDGTHMRPISDAPREAAQCAWGMQRKPGQQRIHGSFGQLACAYCAIAHIRRPHFTLLWFPVGPHIGLGRLPMNFDFPDRLIAAFRCRGGNHAQRC